MKPDQTRKPANMRFLLLFLCLGILRAPEP